LRIHIPYKIYQKCYKWSTKCSKTTTYYSHFDSRDDHKKRIIDHALGKYAEIAFYKFAKSRGLQPTKPDFTITKNKSHSPDIIIKNKAFHVKTQTVAVAKKYGISGVFHSKNNPVGYIVLTVANPIQEYVDIICVAKIKNYQWQSTVKKHKHKKAICLKDIKQKDIKYRSKTNGR
jgi:hypothetical protein